MSERMQFINTMTFKLKTGQTVELAMTKEFLEQVKTAMSLPAGSEITEQHVKAFLVGSMKNTLEQSGGE